MQPGGDRHALDVQDHLAGLGGGLLHGKVHVPAHHHPGQLLLGGILDLHGAHVLALTQHGAAVGHGHDLRQLVGDEEDALPLSGEAPHDLHQLVDLLGGKYGGGLIEDEDLVVPVEHLQDLHTLLHTHGDILHQGVRIHLQPVALRQLHHLFPGLFLLQEAHLVRFHTQNDIIQHGKYLHQLEVLVDHADMQSVGVVGVVDLHNLAIFFDAALFRLVQPEQHAHQGGFSCAVLTKQGVYLSLFQLESDIVICLDPRKFLGDVQHLDHVIRQIHHSFVHNAPQGTVYLIEYIANSTG